MAVRGEIQARLEGERDGRFERNRLREYCKGISTMKVGREEIQGRQ